MLQKSSLDLPVKPQDQERQIKSAKPFSFFLNIAQCQPEPPHYNNTMNKIRATFNSCDETWRNDVTVCLKSANLPKLIQYRSGTSMTLSQHVIPNVHTCGEFQSCPCGECMGSVNTNSSTFPIIAQYHMKSRTTIRAIWHDKKMQQFAENLLYIWPYFRKKSLPNVCDPFKTRHPWFTLISAKYKLNTSFLIYSSRNDDKSSLILNGKYQDRTWLIILAKTLFFSAISLNASQILWMTLILFKTRLDTSIFIYHPRNDENIKPEASSFSAISLTACQNLLIYTNLCHV